MLDKIMQKHSLDIAYFSMAIYLSLIILHSWELVDIIYLCIITFYYIRIKIHRRHTRYLI